MHSYLRIDDKLPVWQMPRREWPRRSWLWLIPLVLVSGCIWYSSDHISAYGHDLQRHFSHSEATQTCSTLEGASDVHILFKSGAQRTHERIPAYLETFFRCVPSFSMHSNLDETVAGHEVDDVLKRVPNHIQAKYPEFSTHRVLTDPHTAPDAIQHHSGLNISDHPGQTKEDSEGWKLDKWKFLPLLEEASKYDKARWYVFMEDDTHVFWSNLLLLLRRWSAEDKIWLGSPSCFGSHIFAHGGSGYIMSRPALLAALEQVSRNYGKYEDMLASDCCGDDVLSYVMADTGVELRQAGPVMNGSPLSEQAFAPDNWCAPLVTLHHVEPVEVEEYWEYEQELMKSNGVLSGQRPLVRGDLFDRFIRPQMLVNGTIVKSGWDNLSEDESITEGQGTGSPDECQQSCRHQEDCLQYSFRDGQCKLNRSVRLGARKSDGSDKTTTTTTSGWMIDRIDAMKSRMGSCQPDWGSWPTGTC